MCSRITYYFPEPLPVRVIFFYFCQFEGRKKVTSLFLFVFPRVFIYLHFFFWKLPFPSIALFFFLLSCLSFLIRLLEHLVLEIWILCVMCVTCVFVQSTICLYSLFMTFFSCTNFELLSSWICHTLSYGTKVSSIA